jgi:hypothetical protein
MRTAAPSVPMHTVPGRPSGWLAAGSGGQRCRGRLPQGQVALACGMGGSGIWTGLLGIRPQLCGMGSSPYICTR